jgi:hypothetical protein
MHNDPLLYLQTPYPTVQVLTHPSAPVETKPSLPLLHATPDTPPGCAFLMAVFFPTDLVSHT